MYITRVHWCNNLPYECEFSDTYIVGIYQTRKEAEETINIFYTDYKNNYPTKEITPLELHFVDYKFDAKNQDEIYPETYEFEVDEIEVGKTYIGGF